MYPFFITAYPNDIVPAPNVAAIRDKTEPRLPPALNKCWIFWRGDLFYNFENFSLELGFDLNQNFLLF